MSDDRKGRAISAKDKEGGYIEPGDREEKRSYETPFTQEKPVPAKETKTVKKRES